MHPKSQIMSLTGQPGSSTATSIQLQRPVYELASEELRVSQNRSEALTISEDQRSVSVGVERPVSLTAALSYGSTLQTRQVWDGTVTEVRSDSFLARLVDKTDPINPDEQAVFEFAEVPEEERAFVTPGSAFYWTIGSERTPAGQIRSISMVQFRRVPAWTKTALARGADRALLLKAAFESGQGADRFHRNKTSWRYR